MLDNLFEGFLREKKYIFRPKTFTERRTYTMVLLLIDTGVRIDEALSLTRDHLDFDNLMIKVRGKGAKERLVPMSYELRAAFIRFLGLSLHRFELVFPTRKGTRQYYGDVYRTFAKLCQRLGIKPIGFHCCRRTYARNYLKNDGNLFYLQASMGHSKLETARRYVEVEPEALKKAHLKTSVLSRLK